MSRTVTKDLEKSQQALTTGQADPGACRPSAQDRRYGDNRAEDDRREGDQLNAGTSVTG